MLQRAKKWAQKIYQDVTALCLAGRDPRTPRGAKIVAMAVVAYALSPIDLIPDFIPVIGLLDDLIIVPLGIMLALRLVPAHLMQEFRATARDHPGFGAIRFGAWMIIILWLAGAMACLWMFVRYQM